MYAQIGINALMLSSMYILMALGFALLLNVMNILNFAHAVIYMVGGYVCYELIVTYGLGHWYSLLITGLLVGSLGIFLERYCFRPFLKNPDKIIIMTLALIVIIESIVNILVGSHVRAIPSFAPGVLEKYGVYLSKEKLVTFIIGISLALSLILFIKKTKRGQQMLALAQDPIASVLQGINIYRLYTVATVIACGSAAVAGSLMGAITNLNPYIGDQMLVKALQVVILAGIGSIEGILVAGAILGSLDSFLPIILSGAATDAVGLAIVILILLFRPKGLFGHEI